MEDWKKEIVKKVPWSATFLVAAFFFFVYKLDWQGWICLIMSIAALFLLIKWEHYERILNRQEKQINFFSKNARDTHKASNEILNISMDKYKKQGDSVTNTD